MSEIETTQPRFRHEIPQQHRASLDTRLRWLWHQRFGTVQQVWNSSPDYLDHTAATIFLQAIMAQDLTSIAMIFERLEGGPITDETRLEQTLAQEPSPI